MPALKNSRHERFAQEIAKGATATKAYVLAGYAENEGNAGRLKGNEQVKNRIAELLEAAEKQTVQKLADDEVKTVKKVAITIESLTQMYLDDRELARATGQAAAAKGCVDSLGKLHGMMIERKETGAPGDFSRMSDDELRQFIEERGRAYRSRLSGTGSAGEPAGVRGKPH